VWQHPERMTNRRSNYISVNNPCPYRTPSFPLSLSLSRVSRHRHQTPGWYCRVNSHLLSPELHMGLVSDTGHDATAWFVAALYQPCTLSSAITVHFGLVGIGPVLLPLFFLHSSSGGKELLLETSLNPYQNDLQGLTLLRCLCSQGSYRIHCQDIATKTEQTLNVPNSHHALYRQAVNLLETQAPWTATQFVQAQYHLAQAWPTLEERYQNLRCLPGHSNSFDA
jgi:hypothetical protein